MNRNQLRTMTLPVLLGLAVVGAYAQPDGLLRVDGNVLFPIGCYELPEDDAGLKAMVDAGINLIRCGSRADLDRLQAAGIYGVMPLHVEEGATDQLREKINSVVDHPALAVWEGPDEVVWNFTAASMLHRIQKVHKVSGEWWLQTPEAITYARDRAAEMMPRMREGIALVRELDTRHRLFWINEAIKSDLYYVRQYLDCVDITGCDVYPIKKDYREPALVGQSTERWNLTGRGKPVWMVLQAFSWNELGDYYGATEVVYPTFSESRFMAYDAIVRGARGVLYWGSAYLKSEPFRQSIYALTRELAALQELLVAPNMPELRLRVIVDEAESERAAVYAIARQVGGERLIVVVNEDETRHMGIELTGLEAWNGTTLYELYGLEEAVVQHGEWLTRLLPYQVKVFASSRRFETAPNPNREFGVE